MTAGLNDSCTGSSYFGSDSRASGPSKVRKKNKKIKKGEAIMMVKKHLAPSHSSAHRNSTSTVQPPLAPTTKKIKASMCIPKSTSPKNVTIKKKTRVSKMARPPNTELLLTKAKQIAGDTKNLHVLQKAIVEFKTQRDYFVQSLNELQNKLKEFEIPDLFTPSLSKMDKDGKHHQNCTEKLKKIEKIDDETVKADDKGDRRKKEKKKKDVRSVSQHFYLADMTESEDTSTTSSSTESTSTQDNCEADATKLSNIKTKDSLDCNLIPIQPPEKGRSLDRVNSLMKHNSPWAVSRSKSTIDEKLDMLKRSVMEVSHKKIPGKVEARRQKSCSEAAKWGIQMVPHTRASVQAELKKLQETSDDQIREKLYIAVNT